MVYGDTRGESATPSGQINTLILTELARVTTNEQPAFVLVPGDLVNWGNLAAFQAWTNIMAPVYQAGIGVYPGLFPTRGRGHPRSNCILAAEESHRQSRFRDRWQWGRLHWLTLNSGEGRKLS